ncbi:hypothetical protein ScPMuIL_005708 [Solemya velum]
MLSKPSIPMSAVLLAAFVIVSVIDISDTRSLEDEDSFFSGPMIKRNSWFSKKSLEDIQSISNNQRYNAENRQCRAALTTYKCYAERCVPTFVDCARDSISDESYEACKLEHRVCASECEDITAEEIFL